MTNGGLSDTLVVLEACFAASVWAVLVFTNARWRLPTIVIVGLSAFQSVGSVAFAGKVLVLGLVLAAILNHRTAPDRMVSVHLQYLALAAVGLCSVLGVASGNHIGDTARDAVSPILIILAPLAGSSLGVDSSCRVLRRLVRIAGVVSALSYFLYWSSKRGLVPNSFGRLGLASWSLPLFCCLLMLCLPDRKRLDSFIASAGLALLLFSGSRSIVVPMAAVPIGAMWVRNVRHKRRFPVIDGIGHRRKRGVVAPAAFAAIVMFMATVPLHFSPYRLIERTTTAIDLTRVRTSDGSYFEREQQTKAGWAVFRHNRFLGAGPGHMYAWTQQFGRKTSSFVLESPSAIFADYGIFGSVILFAFLGLLAFECVRRSHASDPAIALVLATTLFASLVFALVSSPFDDKGLFLAILIGSAWLSAERAEASERERLKCRLESAQVCRA